MQKKDPVIFVACIPHAFKRGVLGVFSLITLVTLLIAVFSHLIANANLISLFFCSDALYLPSVYQDLIIDKNPISGWEFNPAPNFFPDMLVYFILMFITNNFIVSTFVFSILQYVLITWLSIKIFKLIFRGASCYYSLFIFSLFSFFILEFFFFSKDIHFIFYILINAYHSGAFVMTLICLYFSCRYIQYGKEIKLVVIFILGFLMIISDKLFIVLFVIPLCVTCAVMFKKVGLVRVLYLIGTNALFVCIGTLVFDKIHFDSYDMLGNISSPADEGVIKMQFSIYFEQITTYLTHYGIRSIAICLFLLSFILMVYVFIHSLRSQKNLLIPFFALFSILFSLVVISAPMLVGKYYGVDCLRYNIYPVYFTALNISVFLIYKLKNGSLPASGRVVLLGFNLALLIIGLMQFSPDGLKGFLNYYPENVRLMDELADRENLKCGVANYWEAKEITLFSKKGLKVYPVFDDIAFYLHVANHKWFLGNKFNFVVLNRFNDTTLYKTKLKEINYLSYTAQLKVVKTRCFFYSKLVGSAAINTEIIK